MQPNIPDTQPVPQPAQQPYKAPPPANQSPMAFMPLPKTEATAMDWAMVKLGIISIILGIVIAIIIEMGSFHPLHPYELDIKSFGSALLGVVIGVPLIIVGGVRFTRKAKYNKKIEDIQFRSMVAQVPIQTPTPYPIPYQAPQMYTPSPNAPIAPEATVFCSKCGAPAEGGSFCKHCGAKLG